MYCVDYKSDAHAAGVRRSEGIKKLRDAVREAGKTINNIDGRATVVREDDQQEVVIVWGSPGELKRARTLDDALFSDVREIVEECNRQFQSVERQMDRFSRRYTGTLQRLKAMNNGRLPTSNRSSGL